MEKEYENSILELIYTMETANISLAILLLESQNINISNFIEKHFGELMLFCDIKYFDHLGILKLFTLEEIMIIKVYPKIPKNIGILKHLKYLTIRNNNLKKIPTQIFELENLITLDLQGNKLSYIPKDICKLKKLETLELGYNNFKSISKNLNSLNNITRVFYNNNKITRLPKEIKNKSIRGLDISYNKLKTINTIFPYNLNYLNLKFNEITNMPNLENTSIGCLDISNNKITKLPKEIINLKYLNTLLINNNLLSEIPLNILNMPKLAFVTFDNNPVKELLPEIMDAEKDTINLYISLENLY